MIRICISFVVLFISSLVPHLKFGFSLRRSNVEVQLSVNLVNTRNLFHEDEDTPSVLEGITLITSILFVFSSLFPAYYIICIIIGINDFMSKYNIYFIAISGWEFCASVCVEFCV